MFSLMERHKENTSFLTFLQRNKKLIVPTNLVGSKKTRKIRNPKNMKTKNGKRVTLELIIPNT